MLKSCAGIAVLCALALIAPAAPWAQPLFDEEPAAVPPPGAAPLFPEAAPAPAPEAPLFAEPGAAAPPGVPLDQVVTQFAPGQARILTGQRVTDRISGRLLEDVYYDTIAESELQNLTPAPVDNGEWPDLVANDGIWSNFTQSNEYLSPESYEIMRRVIRMIELAEELNPLEFYRIPAASASPFSELPYYYDEEENKDNKIRDWVDKFLKEYRRDPLDPNSEFWSIYIPRPPLKPKLPPPENFDALLLIQTEEEAAADQEAAAQQQGGAAGGAEGGRVGGQRGTRPQVIGGNPVGAARTVSGNTTSYF